MGRDKAVDLLEGPFRCKVVVFHIARHDVRGKGEHGFKYLMHEHIQIRLGAEKVCDALDQRLVVLLLPVALDLGFFQVKWYSLAYIAGILLGWWYLLKLLAQPGAPMAKRHADDLVFYATLGIILGGRIGFEALVLRPPAGDESLRMQTALRLEGLDIGTLAKALDWPPFEGTLEGRIPTVRYADNRIDFDGGLSMDLFGGRVDVDALSIERPFGVAPTVSSDLALHGIDLHALTGGFDFGCIEGRLHGRIDGLRLVDWTATAFDAELHTERARGVRQRISQRAVQNISSVGDASFVTSLQGQLIGVFDDFGYRAIAISCRLRNEVCRMGGLRSGPSTFTIVDGSGLPRLNVVGHNRDVDWPTLVARLVAVAGGDVEPVFD